jgi:hypothetical protein
MRSLSFHTAPARPAAVHRAAAVAATALLAGLLLASARAGAQYPVSGGRTLASTGAVRILNLYGSIRIIGWARDSVEVTGSVSLGERFYFGGSASGVKAGVESDEQRMERGAHLVVRVPAGARVAVKTASAEVEVRDVRGAVDVNTVGGNVRVSGSFAELQVETISGAITMEGSAEFARLRTASGAITTRGSFQDATLSSVSGRIAAERARIAHGLLETVAGDILYDGSVPGAGSLDFDSHGGTIEMRLPAQTAADFDISADASGLLFDPVFAAALGPAKRAGQAKRLEASFSTGAGAIPARITIRSFKGKVILRAVRSATAK